MEDSQIVELYWARDEEAIRQTEQKYGAYLSMVAYNILSDLEDSKECVNDTFLAAWNSMLPHRPNILTTYLSKITRQLSIDVFRRKYAHKRYASEYALSLEELGDTFPAGSTPEQVFDAKLQTYMDEFCFRFNRRMTGDQVILRLARAVATSCGVLS